MIFAEKEKMLRKSAKMTQEKLAGKIGVSKRSVINFEKGESRPRYVKTYKAIAELFGVPVDFLKNDSEDDYEKAMTLTSNSEDKKEINELLTQVRFLFAGGRLTPQDRDGVMRAISELYFEAKEEEQDSEKTEE